ncbi:unnamed protein product [Rotaria magnacalcarata]|uniref:Uncharacterized protein n=2 Tax=Rotaria magnacalcarata TaxID=392030 RepID=A0A8S2J142_9BILA|nr:unnamed protein product [Rotaria magnacalcarata]
MPTRTRQRLLCKKIEAVGKSKYIHIASTKCDEKLRIGYRLLFEAEISDQTIKDCYVHRRCYINVTRNVASITTQQEELEKSLESSTCVAHDDISSEPSCIQTEPDTNMQQIPIINVPSSDPNDFVENIYDYYDDVANTCVSVKTTNGSSITYCRTEMSYDVNLNDGMIMFDQSMNGAEDNLSEITNEQISSSSPAVMNIEEEGSTEILCSSKQLTIEESTSENKTNEYINMTKDTETCVLIDRKNRKSVKSNNTKLKRQRSPSYKILKRISRLSSNAAVDIDHDLNDTVQVNIDNIYTTGFEELCDWLSPVLMKGIIVSMNDIKTKYKQILRMRKERCSSSMLLASAVRARLEQKFGNQIMFYYRRKREGLYVALNDLSVILSKLMHDNKSLSTHHQSVPRVNSNPGTAQRSCENIFETVQLLRQSIENYSHYFSMLKKNRLSLIDLDSNIFWDCIPILLKNFIGLLTASSKEFNEIKKQYDFYSMFTENVLTNHDKKLKIASISYDIINSFNRNFITPKHYLLGNELLRHENSCQLLTITNRLGHTCSYKTMRRLQYEVADKVNTLSDTIQRGQHSNEILNNGFLIKVIDNFDMNKETLHGENSLHMLNQIIVQTIENDESYITANEVINDIIDCISTSTPPSLVVEAIKPPKQLFKYKSCFDLSLKFSLLGYSLVKCFDLFDTNGNIVLSKPIHFPILSGFFATYLNNRIRPIHTGRYCCPIKENPNDVTTIEASLRETKTNILELNRQQTAVVVVDEKLFHICTKVIGNNPNEFDGMFIYPGDFHLIKTTMIVIWQVLDGSGIALDQTIESTINKDGKSHGGISGKFTNESIDVWAKSFSFRAMLSSICHEICKIETNSNSVDSHNECGSSRQVYDNYELQQMLIKLKQEDIFGVHTVQFRKLLSGKIIHHDIIENITTSFIRGEEAMLNYIEDRLVKKNIDISTTLKGMRFLKLSDADTYISGKETNGKKSRLLNIQSKDLSKVLHSVDRLMRDSFIIGEQRDIPLPSIFCHEFTPAPLSLCDINNYHIMNQQKKQIAIDYIRSIFPLSFSSSMPNISGTKALVIDDGAMLQTKPVGRSTTVRPYANQLLKTCDDILDSDYPTLIHNNRAVVASCVRECWSSKITTQQVPYGKVLVVAGPDESSVTLKKFEDPFEDYLLQSNHVEVDTRVFLHAQAISYDNIRSIIIQASDTDVIILGIAHALHLDIDNFYIKSFNTKAKFNTYINVSDIACKLKRKFSMDPMLLLVIHALSGCDTTSFIRNVSKTNIFRTFFSHTHRYSGLNGFFESPLSEESMATAERLLLDCYSTSINSSSLDELRASTAASAFKQNRSRFIAPTLPPTTNGFHHHYVIIEPIDKSDGYEIIHDQIQLKWLSTSQVFQFNQLIMDNSECGVNMITYSQDVHQTDMTNSDNEASAPTDSSTSISMSGSENSYSLLQVTQSSYQSTMSSTDYNSENVFDDHSSRINDEHNKHKNYFDQTNETFLIERNFVAQHNSCCESPFNGDVSFTQPQLMPRFGIHSPSSFNVTPSRMSSSQPTTSTPCFSSNIYKTVPQLK